MQHYAITTLNTPLAAVNKIKEYLGDDVDIIYLQPDPNIQRQQVVDLIHELTGKPKEAIAQLFNYDRFHEKPKSNKLAIVSQSYALVMAQRDDEDKATLLVDADHVPHKLQAIIYYGTVDHNKMSESFFATVPVLGKILKTTDYYRPIRLSYVGNIV